MKILIRFHFLQIEFKSLGCSNKNNKTIATHKKKLFILISIN